MTECKSKKGSWNCLSLARFFKQVCSLKHIAQLKDGQFDDRKNQNVFWQRKDPIRFLVWDGSIKNGLLCCSQPIEDDGIAFKQEPIKAVKEKLLHGFLLYKKYENEMKKNEIMDIHLLHEQN